VHPTYKEIYWGIDEFIEAIPADASFSEAGHSAIAVKAPPEGLCDYEAATRPAKSFTARIDELTDGNVELEVELERWKSAASQAELLNRELEASLEAAQSNASSLQRENERISENCRRIALAAKGYHAQASQANEVLKEILGAFESARAKLPLPSLKP